MDNNLNIEKSLNDLQKVIKGIEREKFYRGFIKEIPKGTLNLFSSKGQRVFKTVYLDNRIAGVNKSQSMEITTSMIVRSFKDNKLTLLKGIQKALSRINERIKRTEFLGDEKSIEDFSDENEDIEKAEEEIKEAPEKEEPSEKEIKKSLRNNK